jgi:hypothetical protein
MKRWQTVASASGFLIVLAFAALRFLQVRTLWSDLSWTDLRDFAGFGLFILMNAAVLLAIIVIFWGGYLFWKQVGPKPPKDRLGEPEYSSAGRLRHVVEVAVLSVVMGLGATGISKMRTPGWWVAGMLNKPGPDLNLGLFIGSAIFVDSAICFSILWGGYLLWMRARQKATGKNLEVGK